MLLRQRDGCFPRTRNKLSLAIAAFRDLHQECALQGHASIDQFYSALSIPYLLILPSGSCRAIGHAAIPRRPSTPAGPGPTCFSMKSQEFPDTH